MFYFRKGRGTRDAIVALRLLYERNLEYNNKVYICYFDNVKAFLSCRLDQTNDITAKHRSRLERDRKWIWNLYNKQVAYVRIEDGMSTACTIGRGVRQGCSLSPLLYLVYDEAVIREATDNMETGISVVCHIINTIRYADDKAVVANSQKGLQQLMDNLNKVTREFGMKINVK